MSNILKLEQGSPGDEHLKPLELINNPEKVQEYKDLLEKYEIEISALSCHGNPVHPNPEIAKSAIMNLGMQF